MALWLLNGISLGRGTRKLDLRDDDTEDADDGVSVPVDVEAELDEVRDAVVDVEDEIGSAELGAPTSSQWLLCPLASWSPLISFSILS